MAEALLPYALTTVQRIKDRLALTDTNFDALILRWINASSDFIENYCERRFKETSYSNELYSVENPKAAFIALRQYPVSAISSFQYKVGTPSTPNYTDFLVDNYEIDEGGRFGLVRVYQHVPTGINSIRASYTAGYKINFANYGDMSTHTLPADLTQVCENLVVRAFKRRELADKSQESYDGGTITWRKELSDEDTMTLADYKRPVILA